MAMKLITLAAVRTRMRDFSCRVWYSSFLARGDVVSIYLYSVARRASDRHAVLRLSGHITRTIASRDVSRRKL